MVVNTFVRLFGGSYIFVRKINGDNFIGINLDNPRLTEKSYKNSAISDLSPDLSDVRSKIKSNNYSNKEMKNWFLRTLDGIEGKNTAHRKIPLLPGKSKPSKYNTRQVRPLRYFRAS